MTILYTARAHVQTGRDGSARTDDGKLEARLAFLRVHAAGVDQPTLAGLAEKAKETCPYSRALRSGVTTVTVG